MAATNRYFESPNAQRFVELKHTTPQRTFPMCLLLKFYTPASAWVFLLACSASIAAAAGADVEHIGLFLGVVGGTDHWARLAGTEADP